MLISKFHLDLEYGKKFENLTAETIGNFKSINFMDGNHPQYDYIVEFEDGTITTFEVKTNRLALRSGLFFIEYANKYGEPSGLAVSTADFWFLCIPSKDDSCIQALYKVPSQILKEARNKVERYTFLAPPQSRTYGFLMSLNSLEQFRVI
jgi:hypothetical protein